MIGLDFKSQYELGLNKNLMALKKPYFGRNDYIEHEDNDVSRLYIGKKGVNKNIHENMI
ncbi:MAG: hypothetical protein GX288_10330 [Clostridiales bacterium]|nr:hypothetical protein [Clostridiales bacterium]